MYLPFKWVEFDFDGGPESSKKRGSRLKLPAGWKFRSSILEQNLDFMTDNGKTMIT